MTSEQIPEAQHRGAGVDADARAVRRRGGTVAVQDPAMQCLRFLRTVRGDELGPRRAGRAGRKGRRARALSRWRFLSCPRYPAGMRVQQHSHGSYLVARTATQSLVIVLSY